MRLLHQPLGGQLVVVEGAAAGRVRGQTAVKGHSPDQRQVLTQSVEKKMLQRETRVDNKSLETIEMSSSSAALCCPLLAGGGNWPKVIFFFPPDSTTLSSSSSLQLHFFFCCCCSLILWHLLALPVEFSFLWSSTSCGVPIHFLWDSTSCVLPIHFLWCSNELPLGFYFLWSFHFLWDFTGRGFVSICDITEGSGSVLPWTFKAKVAQLKK